MRKNSFRRLLFTAVPFLALAACGKESPADHVEAHAVTSAETATVAAARADEGEGESAAEACHDGGSGQASGDYKTNPDDQCRLMAKYNEDVDEGHSPGNYDAFKASMQSAGHYTPGSGTVNSIDANKKMAEDQEILTGSAFEVTLETSGPISAATWTSLN